MDSGVQHFYLRSVVADVIGILYFHFQHIERNNAKITGEKGFVIGYEYVIDALICTHLFVVVIGQVFHSACRKKIYISILIDYQQRFICIVVSDFGDIYTV